MRFSLATLALFFATAASCQQTAGPLAATPPMGWNSWDSYGATINEQQFRDAAAWVAANLKASGYQYVTIDAEWFEPDPAPEGNKKDARFVLDGNGRYLPALNRFPSAADGAGFAPLAAYVHSLGLKFGIHVLQGVPKLAVSRNLPVEGASFTVKESANVAAGCQWNPDNFDLQITPAGQAYYDSIVKLYASWNVDLIKIDCIASRPYKGDEIRMFHEAIVKSGRPILLSLSPGAAPLDETANLQRYSQMWRISDDNWDLWHSTKPYPQGTNDQFPRAAASVQAQHFDADGTGHWPDADMLPLGRLGPAPGWGRDRPTHLTHDEQRTLMNLWSIMRSPLMYGGDPATTDPWTLSLLTNRAVLDVDQHSRNNKSVVLTETLSIWTAEAARGKDHYVAVFNRADTPQTVTRSFASLGLPAGKQATADLWTQDRKPAASSFTLELPAHGSALLLVGDATRPHSAN